MAVHITLSKSTCLLLGASLGVTLSFIIPSSDDADDKKKQESMNKKSEFKDAATSTSKIDEEKQSKFYGDKTMSEILEKAKLGIQKVWDKGWRVVLLNSKNSSAISDDVFVDAHSTLPQTDGQVKRTLDPIMDSGVSDDTLSTIYTPVGELSISKYSTLKKRLQKGLNEMAKGYKRSNTSKNDSICKNYPTHASTLIETEKITIEELIENEKIRSTTEFYSSIDSDDHRKLVLSFKTPFTPIVKVFQAVKRFKRGIKRNKEKSDANTETHNNDNVHDAVNAL